MIDLSSLLEAIRRVRPDMLQVLLGAIGGGGGSSAGMGGPGMSVPPIQVQPFDPYPADQASLGGPPGLGRVIPPRVGPRPQNPGWGEGEAPSDIGTSMPYFPSGGRTAPPGMGPGAVGGGNQLSIGGAGGVPRVPWNSPSQGRGRRPQPSWTVDSGPGQANPQRRRRPPGRGRRGWTVS